MCDTLIPVVSSIIQSTQTYINKSIGPTVGGAVIEVPVVSCPLNTVSLLHCGLNESIQLFLSVVIS